VNSLKKRRLEILRRVEAADANLLFQEFSEHEIGGFEEEQTSEWTREEAYEIQQLVRRGFLEISETKGDEPWLNEAGPNSVYKETYLFLTPAGHDFLEDQAKGWWKKQFIALSQNVVTIGLSALTALVIAWLLDMLGPTP
jgi:hypothetical protein